MNHSRGFWLIRVPERQYRLLVKIEGSKSPGEEILRKVGR